MTLQGIVHRSTTFTIRGLTAILAVVMLLSAMCVTLSAQYRIADRSFDIDDGLSQNAVFALLQDSKGFIWIGTKDGLNRFDGYEFTVYKNNVRDSTSLSGNFVKALLEDDRHNLWIGTGRSLSRLDLVTGRFTHHLLPANLRQTLADRHCIAFAIDDENLLWIGTRSGVYSLSLDDEVFTDYSRTTHPLNELSDAYVSRLHVGAEGRLYLGTFDGDLFVYNSRLKQLTRAAGQQLCIGAGKPLYSLPDGRLLAGTGISDLQIIEADGARARRLHGDSTGFSGMARHIFPLTTSEYLVLTQFSVFLFDIATERARRLFTLNESPAINVPMLDNSGVLWLGTWGSGLHRLLPMYRSFRTVRRADSTGRGLSFSSVRAFLRDRRGRLWVGGHGGLNVLDAVHADGQVWRTLPAFRKRSVYALRQDPIDDDILWVGTTGKGLLRYHVSTGRAERLFDGTHPSGSYQPFKEVYSILETRSGELYFGTDYSLIRYLPRKRTWMEFRHVPGDADGLVNRKYLALYEDRKGRIWVGSDRDGFSIFDPANGQFRSHRSNGDSLSLSANRINVFCEDPDGTMWIGTENGLNRWIPDRGEFRVYTAEDGLPNDYIYGILPDDDGGLWISTNKGLSRFVPAGGRFTNYDVTDGLQSNEFNTLAYYRDKVGRFYFGGIKGFTSFVARNITSNPFAPRVLLTGFRKLNRDFPLARNLAYTDTIELEHSDRIFSIEFASTDYANPDRSRFRYALTGLSENWIYTNAAERIAHFTNLDPGNYELRISAANSDGVWSPHMKSITIVMHPAFWETLWFRAAVLGMLLLITWLLYRSRVNRLKIEARTQRELTGRLISSQEDERERISKALHDDLGQDLLVVSNKLIAVRKDGGEDARLSDSVEILSSSISNISNISHLLHPSELKLLGLTMAVESMVDVVRNASGLDIECSIAALEEHIPDEQRINVYRIIQEALNNIIKHAGASKVIILATEDRDGVQLNITDDGRGFVVKSGSRREGDRPHLGLHGMHERVNMLRGKLHISSSPGKGTTVMVRIRKQDSPQRPDIVDHGEQNNAEHH